MRPSLRVLPVVQGGSAERVGTRPSSAEAQPSGADRSSHGWPFALASTRSSAAPRASGEQEESLLAIGPGAGDDDVAVVVDGHWLLEMVAGWDEGVEVVFLAVLPE